MIGYIWRIKQYYSTVKTLENKGDYNKMKLGIVANLPRFIFSIKMHKTQ